MLPGMAASGDRHAVGLRPDHRRGRCLDRWVRRNPQPGRTRPQRATAHPLPGSRRRCRSTFRPMLSSASRGRPGSASAPSLRCPIRPRRGSRCRSLKPGPMSRGKAIVALSLSGPDGMTGTVTITVTARDPASAFADYVATLARSKPDFQVDTVGVKFCGYSSQKLSGTFLGPQGAVEFADRHHPHLDQHGKISGRHSPGRAAGCAGFRCRESRADARLLRRHTLNPCPPSSSTCHPGHSGWARRASTPRKRRSTP